jgi:hypothetical protein
MLSVVIATQNSERELVTTLASLVPGLMVSAVREVIVADVGSTDGTRRVVDFAGCTLLTSALPLGARLAAAAATARGDWLMFLRPGAVLDSGWANEALEFGQTAPTDDIGSQAAVFRRAAHRLRARPLAHELAALIVDALSTPTAEYGLIVSKALYQHLGGHRDESDPENAFIRRIGRRRLARLRTAIHSAGA